MPRRSRSPTSVGTLDVGTDADLVVLNADGDACHARSKMETVVKTLAGRTFPAADDGRRPGGRGDLCGGRGSERATSLSEAGKLDILATLIDAYKTSLQSICPTQSRHRFRMHQQGVSRKDLQPML